MTAQGTTGVAPAPPRQQDRLFHDLVLPEEAVRVRADVREFADREVAPRARAVGEREESYESFPRDLFAAMAEAGLFALPFGPDLGAGLEYPVCATATAVEELAYRSSSIAAIYDVHCILAGHALDFGGAALRQRYLRPLIAGQVVGAFATTEPGASSDLSPTAVTTVADRSGDGWVVNGRKRFITNSPVADFIVTLCRTGDNLTLLVVDSDPTRGVDVGPPDRKLGNRGQLTADVRFADVPVPEENVIGEVGQGLRLALATLTYGRIGIGAAGVGIGQAAFDLAVEHLRTRRAFGRRLAQFQYWQFRMAERAAQLDAARTLYQKAALRLDGGVAFPEPEAAMAKVAGTELAVDMTRDAIQVFGGYGFLRELGDDGTAYRLEELYRDAKIGEIYEGANEIQKWIVARTLFGRELTG